MKNEIRKLRAADHYTIPGHCEAVIDVLVDRKETDDYLDAAEPTQHFKETYPLQMDAVLVNINASPTSKVRGLNPFPTSVSVYQDAVLGQAENIQCIKGTIKSQEHPADTKNNIYLRRVTTNKNTQIDQSNQHQKEKPVSDIPEHLKALYESASKNHSSHERQAIANLLVKIKDSFSVNDLDLGLTTLTEHSINTGDAYPIKQHPRRVHMAYAEAEKKAVEEMLAKGVIRKSTSPWTSSIVLVAKKNRQVRSCVDYRKVNALVKSDGCPLPRIQDCLDAVAGSTLFSTFDLTSGDFQIPLKEEDIPKSAFVCNYGLFEMLRLPFVFNNAAATFQRTMDIALQGLQWETCLIYIYDIVV